uniref:RING-type domain-containing protein n=1 Tax=Elaeophora elaphi TaxID=1147741 RepID=A0A0R3RUZ8_9BILA
MDEGNVIFCSICLGTASWPKARPSMCKHTFCYLCISVWVKIDEEHSLFQETEDITVSYARCQVCNLSKDEHLLLLCDGIIGQNVDGSSVRCNAACHCYCLPKKLESVPDGDWFCPFCTDIRATQESVYNRRYARRRHRSSSNYLQFMDFRESGVLNEDRPGPSRINESFRLRRYVNEFFTESGSGSVEDGASDGGLESDPDFLANIDSSKDDDADWDNLDDTILDIDSDTGYPAGMTEVTQRKRHKHRRVKKNFKKAKKRKGTRKRSVKHRSRSGNVSKKNIRRKNRRMKNIRKRKGMTEARKRLAEAIGLDPLNGRQKKRAKNARSLQSAEHLSDKISNEKPVGETDLITSIMFEQAKTLAPAQYQRILRDGTIGESEQMIKQRKKLIDEKIVACKEIASSEGLKDSDENKSMYSASGSHIEAKEKRKRRPSRWGTPTTSKSHDNTIITASIPLPLGPPLTQSAVSLENIPVPSTDQQPQQSQMALPSIPSALNKYNYTFVAAASTSFALKSASIPSFGIATGQPQISLAPFAGSGLGQQPLGLSQQSLVTLGQQQLTSLGQQTLAGLGQQPVPSLSQPQLSSIGQGSLVQMQPSLLPNFFIPPLNLGAMNGLLAAGLLANNNPLAAPPITQPLGQPSSATTTPFMLNPVQLSAASAQQLNQHFVNLATTLRRNGDTTTDSAHFSQQPPKQPEGVPPPPPVMKPSESTTSSNISLCEPLAEKIRKLIEASNVRPLCDSSVEDGTAKIGITIGVRFYCCLILLPCVNSLLFHFTSTVL